MTWFDDGGNKPPHEPRYCLGCKAVRSVTLIRGHNGERDRVRCNTCRRTWPVGRLSAADVRLAAREDRGKGRSRAGDS